MTTNSPTDLAVQVINDWQTCRSRFILGITGPPAAGKSTLAITLRDQINAKCGQHVAEIAPMDGFHLPNAVLDRRGLRAQKGAPDTFDADAYIARLTALRQVPLTDVRWPTYDRVVLHDPIPDAITISPQTGVVITEGNYLLLDEAPWAKVSSILNQTWYLSTEQSVFIKRLRQRHYALGRTVEETEKKINETDLPNSHIIEASKSRADRILN